MDWITSDTHFFHRNVIKYCDRPFTDVDHMNEIIVSNWNNLVSPNDRVFHLGDFSFGNKEQSQNILDRLNGIKHLIIGNHDKTNIHLVGWNWIKHYHEETIDKQFIVFSHYSMRVWNRSHRGSWQLYGHSHGSLPDDHNALSIDVGVDCHDYKPLSIRDIKTIMRKKTYKPVDHHD